MSLKPLFPSPCVVDVLCLFLTKMDEQFYQRQIADITGYELRQVQNALGRIEESGLIGHEKNGNRVYYFAETKHPAFEDLVRAFLKTDAVATTLKLCLQPIMDKIDCAFVFGSIAKGTAKADSDIDLMIVGGLGLKEVSTVLASDRVKSLGRELNAVVWKSSELKRRISEESHFALELLESDKIWLKGNQDDFESMAQ